MMIQNHRFELFRRVGTFGIIARYFVGKTSACRDFDSLERGSQSVKLFCEDLAKVCARSVSKCRVFFLYDFVCHCCFVSLN